MPKRLTIHVDFSDDEDWNFARHDVLSGVNQLLHDLDQNSRLDGMTKVDFETGVSPVDWTDEPETDTE